MIKLGMGYYYSMSLLLMMAILSNGLVSCVDKSTSSSVKNSKSPLAKNSPSVESIARQVTVRILTPNGLGSGVIIKHKKQVYTVLTNHHVVNEPPETGYSILTEDGKIYPAKKVNKLHPKKFDVAVIEFNSNQSYKIVKISKMDQVGIGDVVYASGFPAWHFKSENEQVNGLESTRDWGTKAFRVTKGLISMLPQKSLEGGYQIGYTNEVVEGMSGGPVLNDKGELIGINGQLKYPFQEIQAFRFIDGTYPSQPLFKKMEALSWGIPLTGLAFFLN